MANVHKTKTINCEHHILSACLAVNASLQKVKSLFRDEELAVIDYSNKTEKETLVEVTFDTATLTCLFDENGICEGVFLFLDDILDITHYIEYCNKTYPCNFILQGWVINNCCVQVTAMNKECSLLVLPMKIKQAKEFIA